jgi:hypothetical protein
MTRKPPLEFMAAHGIDADEVWEVRAGTGTYAVKHSALERVAAAKKIAFDPPLMLEFHAAEKIAVLCVTGVMGDRKEWSIGEATPYNNKNGYPFAMAEKRAKDRVILKLLNAHGTLYSDSEADDFVRPTTIPKRENPHVVKPEDTGDYTHRVDPATGEIVDCIPVHLHRAPKLLPSKPETRVVAEDLLKRMREQKTAASLVQFAEATAEEWAALPDKWMGHYQAQYQTLLDNLRKQQKAA